MFALQGLLDLNLLAGACGVHKPPIAAVHQDEVKKQLLGIRTFYSRESWSLAGVQIAHECDVYRLFDVTRGGL
jgi:hypothetical protein